MLDDPLLLTIQFRFSRLTLAKVVVL